jgi:hypothetical protein
MHDTGLWVRVNLLHGWLAGEKERETERVQEETVYCLCAYALVGKLWFKVKDAGKEETTELGCQE